MTFSIKNALSKLNTLIVVEHKGKELEFVVSTIISKRNKDKLDDPNQFTLLNLYLEYKGEAYQDDLFNRLTESNNIIFDNITVVDIFPLPYRIVGILTEVIDLGDIFNFLKYEYKLPIPSSLFETFDYKIEENNRGSRIQTYLKDEYIELAALAIAIKITIGPVCQFAYVRQHQFENKTKEYLLAHFYIEDPIYDTPAMQKLLGLIEKLIETSDADGDNNESRRVLERSIPSIELPNYILGIVLIQKLSITPIIGDDEKNNTVTRIYNYANYKLIPSGDVTKSIRAKEPLKDIDSNTSDSESLMESHRISDSITMGSQIEMNWFTDSVDKIITQLPMEQRVKIDPNMVKDAYVYAKQFKDLGITDAHVFLLSIIFKKAFDPRILDYLYIDNIINLMAVGFSYLIGIDCGYLGLLLLSTTSNKDDQVAVVNYNQTVNKSRINKDYKEELDKYFPYKRVINDKVEENIAGKAISDIVTTVYESIWVYVGDTQFLKSIAETDNKELTLPSDLKIMFTEFLINNERICYGD